MHRRRQFFSALLNLAFLALMNCKLANSFGFVNARVRIGTLLSLIALPLQLAIGIVALHTKQLAIQYYITFLALPVCSAIFYLLRIILPSYFSLVCTLFACRVKTISVSFGQCDIWIFTKLCSYH